MIRRSVFLLMLCASASALAQNATTPAAATPATEAAVPAPQAAPEPDPLVIKDDKIGSGDLVAGPGSKVAMHYTGWLYKPMAPNQRARKFDSSHDRREPLEFVLGQGVVIKGWDQGIVGMKVGGKRTLIIPARLAYGSRGAPGGGIPPNSDLIFDVELVSLK